MKTLERMMLEMLFAKKEAPPTKAKKLSGDLTVKQMIKIMKNMPTFKKEFEEALKSLEPKKDDKDKLTFWQKVVVIHLGSLAYLATLVLLFRLTFH